jgi:dephospho-CoA kinase
VDSIRNPAEVAALRHLGHFVLFGVYAALETRFARSLARARPGDPATLDEFRERERQENSADPEGQQLEATFRLADRIVDNDGELTALGRSVDRALEACGFPASSG